MPKTIIIQDGLQFLDHLLHRLDLLQGLGNVLRQEIMVSLGLAALRGLGQIFLDRHRHLV